MPKVNRQLPLVNPLSRTADAMSPAERRELAREQADDAYEALYQAEYWMDQTRKRLNALYLMAFREEAPAFEPEFRKQASA